MARQEVATSLVRLPERDDTRMVPRGLTDGLVEVDATWGTVQPLAIAEEVKTTGEHRSDGVLLQRPSMHRHP